MPLTDTAIRNAKPGVTPAGKVTDKPYKIGDAGGLYLEVAPSGGKWWRLKYHHGGKEKRLSLGVYPTQYFTIKAQMFRNSRVFVRAPESFSL